MRRRNVSQAAVSVAVFLSGAALLGVELAASRVLAPYFGNSIYVWGALIGVVLAGLAAGYWLGGVVVDRWPRVWLLVAAITVGGFLVFAVPFVDDPVLGRLAAWNPGPRANPLIASTVLFGLTSVILATVTPIAVRLRALELSKMGRTSGGLFSLSTAGSIVGVFATSFFLIPSVGVEQLFALAAASLFLAAALVTLAEKMVVVFPMVLVALATAIAGALTLGDQLDLTEAAPSYTPAYRVQGKLTGARPDLAAEGLEAVYRKDSQYHRITVADSDDSRFLRFNSSFQSGMYLSRPFELRFEYNTYLNLALAYQPSARDVLMIGLGGGSSQKQMWRDFPTLEITTVELDPTVRDVAYRFFELPRDERLKVVVDDGRRFLATDEQQWDVIILDAFYADAVPFHLATAEFLDLIRARLRPGGVLATNAIGALTGPQSRLFRSFLRTYQHSFPAVAVHPVKYAGHEKDDALRNIILIAGDGSQPDEKQLRANWEEVKTATAPALGDALESRDERDFSLSDVPVLTDDYAPTDALLLFE